MQRNAHLQFVEQSKNRFVLFVETRLAFKGRLNLIRPVSLPHTYLHCFLCVATCPTCWITGFQFPWGAFITFGCQKVCVGGVPSTDNKVSHGQWFLELFSPCMWRFRDAFSATFPPEDLCNKLQAQEAEEGGGDNRSHTLGCRFCRHSETHHLFKEEDKTAADRVKNTPSIKSNCFGFISNIHFPYTCS